MIDPQAYRLRIGMFCIRTRTKLKSAELFHHDSTALGIALILTLLVIGGVEQNPGPDFTAEHPPGPSFSDVTLMDVMEAIRISQLQVDQLTRQVNEFMKAMTVTSSDGQYGLPIPTTTSMCTCSTLYPTPPTSSDRSPTKPTSSATNETKAPLKSTSPSLPITGADARSTVTLQRRSRPGNARTNTMPRVGAVMLGCLNVRRIAAAARDEFLLGEHVVFKSITGGTARSALGVLRGAVASCRAISADLVLHLGGSDLARQSVEYTLDCIAEVIKTAKQVNKVRDIVVCSVPQDPSPQMNCLTIKRKDLNDELERLCLSEGIRFLDLRPRLSQCAYHGLDRSRLNLNRDGCRNAWQVLASEVTGFLD